MFNNDFVNVYNLIHKKKNYYQESLRIINFLKSFRQINHSSLLDFGCGQADHLYFLNKCFKSVEGYDPNKNMIKVANTKYKDIKCNFDINFYLNKKKKYDFIISMFDVFSYFTTNNILKKNVLYINKLLKKNGLYLFEFWFEDSVLINKPNSYVKHLNVDNKILKKSCTSKINLKNKTVSIKYIINYENKSFYDNHLVRYFSKEDIKFFLRVFKFEIIKFGYMSDLRKSLKPSDKYSAFCLAKKINNV
tara:strand:- start:1394 stop:2137 length:744 start_codon:yes stop_codon:yes gene_type:complete